MEDEYDEEEMFLRLDDTLQGELTQGCHCMDHLSLFSSGYYRKRLDGALQATAAGDDIDMDDSHSPRIVRPLRPPAALLALEESG